MLRSPIPELQESLVVQQSVEPEPQLPLVPELQQCPVPVLQQSPVSYLALLQQFPVPAPAKLPELKHSLVLVLQQSHIPPAYKGTGSAYVLPPGYLPEASGSSALQFPKLFTQDCLVFAWFVVLWLLSLFFLDFFFAFWD